jgi:hypothetical protein
MTRLAPAIRQRFDPIVNQAVLGRVDFPLSLSKCALQYQIIVVERRDAILQDDKLYQS